MAANDNVAEIIALAHDYCFARWNAIFIVIWRHETTSEGVHILGGKLKEHHDAYPGGGGLLTIIEQGAPMPTSEVRTDLARFLTEGARVIRSSAVAFEGAGFRAAAVRGVVTGLTMLARQPYPHKVFATMADAAQWLGTSLKETAKLEVDSAALLKALNDLRTRVNKG